MTEKAFPLVDIVTCAVQQDVSGNGFDSVHKIYDVFKHVTGKLDHYSGIVLKKDIVSGFLIQQFEWLDTLTRVEFLGGTTREKIVAIWKSICEDLIEEHGDTLDVPSL